MVVGLPCFIFQSQQGTSCMILTVFEPLSIKIRSAFCPVQEFKENSPDDVCHPFDQKVLLNGYVPNLEMGIRVVDVINCYKF